MHVLIDIASTIVTTTAVLTGVIAIWSLVPRPQRILRSFK